MSRKIAFLLALCLLLMPLYALADAFAPLYTRYNEALELGETAGLILNASLHDWQPFPKERMDPFARLLKHVAVKLHYQGGDDKMLTDYALQIGDVDVATVSVTKENAAFKVTTDLIDDITLTSSDGTNPLETVLNMTADSGEFDAMLNEDNVFYLSDDLRKAYQLTETITVEGKQAKVSKKLGEFGNAAKGVTYTLSGLDAQDIWTSATADMHTPFIKDTLHGMQITSDKVTLTRYLTKQDEDIAQAWAFTMRDGETERKVTLMWAYREADGMRTDSIEWVTTAKDGKDKKTFTANIQMGSEEKVNKLSVKTEQTQSIDKVKHILAYDVSLQNVFSKDNERLFGDISQTVTVGDAVQGMTLSPSVAIIDQGDALYASGSVRIKIMQDAMQAIDAEIMFSSSDDLVFKQLDSSREQTMTQLSAQQLETLQKSLMEKLLKNVVMATLALPKEDLTILMLDAAELDRIIDATVKAIPLPK